MHVARDKEQKRVKLATETDEQYEKCLRYHHEWKKIFEGYLKYNESEFEFASAKTVAKVSMW